MIQSEVVLAFAGGAVGAAIWLWLYLLLLTQRSLVPFNRKAGVKRQEGDGISSSRVSDNLKWRSAWPRIHPRQAGGHPGKFGL